MICSKCNNQENIGPNEIKNIFDDICKQCFIDDCIERIDKEILLDSKYKMKIAKVRCENVMIFFFRAYWDKNSEYYDSIRSLTKDEIYKKICDIALKAIMYDKANDKNWK